MESYAHASVQAGCTLLSAARALIKFISPRTTSPQSTTLFDFRLCPQLQSHLSCCTTKLSPMASLVGLPIELLENVLVDLQIDDVSSLSRTCKDAHRYLSPRVYHSIHWCWKDGRACPPYHLLLRSLLSNPSLASHVKTINLRGGVLSKRVHGRNNISVIATTTGFL